MVAADLWATIPDLVVSQPVDRGSAMNLLSSGSGNWRLNSSAAVSWQGREMGSKVKLPRLTSTRMLFGLVSDNVDSASHLSLMQFLRRNVGRHWLPI